MKMQGVSITLLVVGKNGHVRSAVSGTDRVLLNFEETFEEGDVIKIESDTFPVGLSIRFDEKISESHIWLADKSLEFPVPLNEVGKAYPPGAFEGAKHQLSATLTDTKLFECYRNLSVNPLDRHGESTYYPHCTATHESDNHDPRFAARNAIDGILVPYGHWNWPYTSWGNDKNPDAEIKIEFGRSVFVDKVMICLRADFPHDNWWRELSLLFSDGTSEVLNLRKTGDIQEFSFVRRRITWIKIAKLVQCEDDPSPYPALVQWVVYGFDCLPEA